MTQPTRRLVVVGLCVSLVLGGVLSYFASQHPDGLEWVAEEIGFLDSAEENDLQGKLAPLPDYGTPGMDNEFVSVSVAGVVGTLVVFGAALGLAWLLRARGKAAPQA